MEALIMESTQNRVRHWIFPFQLPDHPSTEVGSFKVSSFSAFEAVGTTKPSSAVWPMAWILFPGFWF
jgi:hypothetical protein